MDINSVNLTGNLGGDIELRYTPKGTAVTDVNLAVQGGFGENKKTNWIGLTIWGKSAEAAAQYLGKGRKVAVSGHLDQEEWSDKQSGKKRTKTRVIVENWTFADSKGADSGPRQETPQAAAQSQQPTSQTTDGDEIEILRQNKSSWEQGKRELR